MLDNTHNPERVRKLRVKAQVNVGLIALATNLTPRAVLRQMLRDVSPDEDWHESQRDAFVDSYAACRSSTDTTIKDVVA